MDVVGPFRMFLTFYLILAVDEHVIDECCHKIVQVIHKNAINITLEYMYVSPL